MSRWKDVSEIAKGIQLLAYAPCHTRFRQIDAFWRLDRIRSDLEASADAATGTAAQILKSSNLTEIAGKSCAVAAGLQQGGPILIKRLAEEVCDYVQFRCGDSGSESAVNIDIEQVDANQDRNAPIVDVASAANPKHLLQPEAKTHLSGVNGSAKFHTCAVLCNKDFVAPTSAVPSSVTSGQTTEHETQQNARQIRPAKKRRIFNQKLTESSQESKVPASRIGRLMNYSTLGVGLGVGAISEVVRQTFGSKPDPEQMTKAALGRSPFLTEANAERIVRTLCRVRGAALKLGQMLSIQDTTILHPQLQQIFERVRHSADFMPFSQVESVLEKEYGQNWRGKIGDIEEKPFAAASIGQVHRSTLPSGEEVALKIQYPGVATSIDSDIRNLTTLLNFSSLLPKGLYAEAAVKTARIELADECDYKREAWAANRFRKLIAHDPTFYVPAVYDDLTTKQILVTEVIYGKPVDTCGDLDQNTRDLLAQKMIELCLKEVFIFRFMQSDPNWSNFFWDEESQRIMLLDFGACREYSKKFVDGYLNIIRSAADNNREAVLKYSVDIGFLTGYEDKMMQDAHCDAVEVLGTALSAEKPLHFGKQDITKRVEDLAVTMVKHRLTPPPPETYSIHRKMAGTFLLCTKLNATVHCRPLFDKIFHDYIFD